MEKLEGSRMEGSRRDVTSIRHDGSHKKLKDDIHEYSIRKMGSSRKGIV
jgi:hypothetical protein